MSGATARTLAPLLALALIAAAGCAKREPPSGGPPDIEPPRVLTASPDSGSAGVARDAELSITFTEGMEPRSTERAVSLAPPVEIGKYRWKKHTLTLVPAEPLDQDRTYLMFIANQARDRHGNPMRTGHAIIFSTADSFPPGRIEGEIQARGMSAAGIYLWCYDAAAGKEPDSTARDFDALGQADPEGRFRVDGLAVPGRYALWAFGDLNGNRSFEPDIDVLARVDTTLTLTTEAPVASDVQVVVINPRAPAKVDGAVVDSLGAEGEVLSVRVRDVADSSRTFVQVADSDRTFGLEIQPATWELIGFHDANKNGQWDEAEERASAPLLLTLSAADEVRGVELVLPPPAAVEEK